MQAALVILDGWGLADHDHLNAVVAADTPTFDEAWSAGATTTLRTYGQSVGLAEGLMGNSEVGHLTIGAGRAIEQASRRIDLAIEAGEFCANPAIKEALDDIESTGGRLHLLGLVSDAGVHSDHRHLHELIECAAERGLEAVTHVFTDGRDTAPDAGEGFIETLESRIEAVGTGEIATVCGRYYGMDRDGNWDRTKRAYDCIVDCQAPHEATSGSEAIREAYIRGETDEFVEPITIIDAPGIEDGDAVIFVNYRADRARQLTRMLGNIDPEWEFETDPPAVNLVTMTEYDRTFDLPVAFESKEPEETLGSVLEDAGLTQLRIAESEKYAHVTYFINGGREIEFDGEIREIIPSPDVPTYEQAPEMSAGSVTDTAIDVIESRDPDVMILNYANPDMVGHTGEYEAAIDAIEAVDTQLGRLLEVLQAGGVHTIVTADHGNADDMGTPDRPHTAHTFNPAPFIYLAPDGTDGGVHSSEEGDLADISPTLLSLLSIEKPSVMTGHSLLEP